MTCLTYQVGLARRTCLYALLATAITVILFLDVYKLLLQSWEEPPETEAASYDDPTHLPNLARRRPTVILPLGDSITDGGTKLRSYRYHLAKLLERAGHNVDWAGSLTGVYNRLEGENVSAGILWRTLADWPAAAQIHEGHWGWTAQQLLSGNTLQPQRGKLDDWLWRGLEVAAWPDVALVHLGTNDLTQVVATSPCDAMPVTS